VKTSNAAPALIEWWQDNRPTALKAAAGLQRSILQHVPDRLLQEAEQLAETGWGEGWRFLLQQGNLPPACYDFFRAARSAEIALERLAHMALGVASARRSLQQKVTDPHQRMTVFRRLYALGSFRNPADYTPEQWRLIAPMRRKLLAILREGHRRRRRPVEPPEAAYAVSRMALCLVQGWLTLGIFPASPRRHAAPGFCFFRDTATLDLLSFVLGHDLELDTLRRLRQRLGLVAMPRRPVVKCAPHQTGVELYISQAGQTLLIRLPPLKRT
jgi:hypothetical protein